MSSIVRLAAVRGVSVAAVLAVTQAAWAAPAAGEFSAVDQMGQPAAEVALTRADAHARMVERTAAGAWMNGEVTAPATVSAEKAAAPMDVRAQGRQALRSHRVLVGDVTL